MTDLAALSATDLSRHLAEGRCSSREIVERLIAVIDEVEPSVRAFVDVDREGALAEASRRDGEQRRGPLHGIPVVIKDTVDVAGLRCIWGTPIHKDRVPASDAVVVRRLRDAGAVILGTTVTTEYAIARAGPTRNPHDLAHTPGGSSSGSAAAVAAHMAPLAVATQSVGSIVRPSSYCGIFGLKASKGAVSTTGCMPLSPHLDHIGPMARSVADIALAASCMFDGGDARGAGVAVPTLSRMRPGMRVLRVEGPMRERIEAPSYAALDRAEQALTEAGCRVEPLELPERFSSVVGCYETIIYHDMAERHGEDRDRHGDEMSERFRDVIDVGRSVTAQAYQAALSDVAYFKQTIAAHLNGDVVILTPSTDGSAPLFSERTGEQKLQALWTLVGTPSLATPCGMMDGLPISVQIVALHGRDSLTLAAAAEVEQRWPLSRPMMRRMEPA